MPFATKENRGRSSWDLAHYWSTNYVYELPFGPGKAFGGDLTGVGGKLLEGWSLGGILTLNSGPPFSAALNFDYAEALLRTVSSSRPDLGPAMKFNPVLGGPDKYFDPLAFELPPLTPECAIAANRCSRRVFGNVGRSTITGPGLATFDVNLLKTTKLTENTELQFRAEFFNLFNRANFRLPTNTVFLAREQRNAQAGRITAVSTAGRQIQFALKLVF